MSRCEIPSPPKSFAVIDDIEEEYRYCIVPRNGDAERLSAEKIKVLRFSFSVGFRLIYFSPRVMNVGGFHGFRYPSFSRLGLKSDFNV